MRSQFRVHVAVIDHHVDRITESMIRLRADKAYLVSYYENDSASQFLKKTKKILVENNIPVKVIFVDIWDELACMKKFREIIKAEDQSQFFFNLSTGTKITSIASMLTCLIWNCEPYYAKTEYDEVNIPKNVRSEEIGEIITMPTFNMISPKSDHLKVLTIIKQNNGKIKKKYLIEKLKKLKMILSDATKELSKPAEHGHLKTILDPMIRMEYVNIINIGRDSIVKITEKGENILNLFGDWQLK